MSGRNHGPPMPLRGMPHGDPMPRHMLLEETRETQFDHRKLPRHPAIIEKHLSAQHEDIQNLLGDNQRLAATHVALKQELEAVQFELQRTAHFASSLHPEKDIQMRELYDKSVKMEMDLGKAEAMKTELMQVHSDIKELTMIKQDLTTRVQNMTQDLTRVTTDLQQAPPIKADIDDLKQELHRTRAAIEYEKKMYEQNYEHGQVLEKNLVSMARELEKLRSEMANVEMKARASAVVGNPAGFNATYPEAGYSGNPYPPNYGGNPMNPVGTENYAQYGHGPGAWGGYDMQRGQGHR